jgi:tRNA pseudouridine38-40 synthase
VTTRLRIDLAYDGTGFSGWAKQPGRPSVQGALEEALCRVLRCDADDLAIVVAGRTDAGVHATGQVCHVDVSDRVTLPSDDETVFRLARRLNGALGKSGSVVVHSVRVAPEGFDARFSPLARRYAYLISDAQGNGDPRTRNHVLWVGESLDLDRMNTLAVALIGLHDFAAFCRAREGATTIRHLQTYTWIRRMDGVLEGSVVADAFCHSMVRSLVGAAVAVGSGKCSVEEVIAARDRAERTSLWKTMPAHGLTLEEVIYPEERDLQARAEQTRGVRTLGSN